MTDLEGPTPEPNPSVVVSDFALARIAEKGGIAELPGLAAAIDAAARFAMPAGCKRSGPVEVKHHGKEWEVSAYVVPAFGLARRVWVAVTVITAASKLAGDVLHWSKVFASLLNAGLKHTASKRHVCAMSDRPGGCDQVGPF